MKPLPFTTGRRSVPERIEEGGLDPPYCQNVFIFFGSILVPVGIMQEIEKVVWGFPLFKTYEEKERFFKVLGLLVSHQITFEKAAELLKLDREKLAFLLDLLEIDYSFLDEEEANLEKEAVKKLLEELKSEDSH